jgi:hypothetical protein
VRTSRLRWLFPAFFFLIHTVLSAQDLLTESALVPHTAIKVSPLHLLNFYPTIEWSFEQRILPRFTTQLEVGYVLNYRTNIDRDFQDKRGVKLKLEGRYYFGSVSDRKKIYYGAIEPYMNVINFDRASSSEECFDLECQHRYRREYFEKVAYREHGVSLKIGLLRYLGSRIFLDINSGFTIRTVRYRKTDRPRSFNEFEESGFLQIPNENDRIGFSPNLGLRLGYRFN